MCHSDWVPRDSRRAVSCADVRAAREPGRLGRDSHSSPMLLRYITRGDAHRQLRASAGTSHVATRGEPSFALDGVWWRPERWRALAKTPTGNIDFCDATTPPSPARPQIARRRPGIKLGRARLTAGAGHRRRTRARATKLTAHGVPLCGEIQIGGRDESTLDG
jgi:hypothetical protein